MMRYYTYLNVKYEYVNNHGVATPTSHVCIACLKYMVEGKQGKTKKCVMESKLLSTLKITFGHVVRVLPSSVW